MIRVVVTGSECTGKTTLARALAEHYGTIWSPEYAREFVLDKGSAPEYRDVDAIARGQIDLEDGLAAKASRLLIQDTDLLSTVIYSLHYYGNSPSWIDQALRERHANLYLLADIDVLWVPDGNHRDRGKSREEMQELFRADLIDRRLRFVEVSGSGERRLQHSVSLIDELLSG